MKFYGINFLKRVAILANPLYFQQGWPMQGGKRRAKYYF